MRHILVLTLFFSISFTAFSQVNFIINDFEKAIALSKETGKPIFIDFYTTWCGPCKMLDKVTFQDKRIAKFMNENFVNLKIDCEKDYGIDLSMKYRIRSYPSFGLIDSDNRLYAKDGGYSPDLDLFMNVINSFKEKFESGKYLEGINNNISLDYPDFYKGIYHKTISFDELDYNQIVKYLNENDPKSEVYFAVLSRFYKTEYAKYLDENIDDYIRLFGKTDVQNLSFQNLSWTFEKSVEKKDYSIVSKEIKAHCEKFEDDEDKFHKYYKSNFYKETGDWTSYLNYVSEEIESKSNEAINEVCWDLYESDCPKEKLEQPLKWMAVVVKEEENWAYIDTYAALLYKAEKFLEARNQARKAIEVAKKNGEDASGTEELLKKIEEACRNC